MHGVRRVARAKAARGGACSPKQVLPPDRRPQSKHLVGRLGARQVGPRAIACHAGARGRSRDRRHPSLPPWQWVHLRLAPGRPRGKILSTLRGHRTVKSAGSLPAVVQLWWQAAIDRSREFSARNARSTSGRRRECACVRYAPTILGTSREVPSKNFTLTADRDKISTAQNCGRVPGRARAAPLRVAHIISRDFGYTFLLVGTRARAHSARRAGCCVREACCLHLSSELPQAHASQSQRTCGRWKLFWLRWLGSSPLQSCCWRC